MHYVRAYSVHVGQWLFYPEAMIAQNIHNGAIANFGRDVNGSWVVGVINCPAEWMLKQLAEWFSKWINGSQTT